MLRRPHTLLDGRGSPPTASCSHAARHASGHRPARALVDPLGCAGLTRFLRRPLLNRFNRRHQRNRRDTDALAELAQIDVAGIDATAYVTVDLLGVKAARALGDLVLGYPGASDQVFERLAKRCQLWIAWLGSSVARHSEAASRIQAAGKRAEMTKLVFQTKDCALWDLLMTTGDDRADERELRVLGQAIRELRERQGRGLGALAEAAGITDAELAAIETGRLDPGYRRLRHLAKGLGVKPIALLLRIEELKEDDAG